MKVGTGARIRRNTFNTIFYFFVILAVIATLFPLVYAVILAFITEKAGYLMYEDPSVIFKNLTFDNFIKVFTESSILRWIGNSFIIALLSMVLSVFISSLAAFGYSRLQFKGKNILFRIILLSMLVPGVINIIPNYIIIRKLGLVDNLIAMIIPGLGGMGSVFMLVQFMQNIPKDYDEVARVEGASNFTIYSRVILPICKPALITQAIFAFQGSWNDFLWPIIVTNSDENRTLSSGLYKTLMSDAQYRGSLMAASIISAIPVILVFLFGQKYFMQGVGRGGIKG